MFCYLFFYTGRHNFGWAAKDMAADLNISYTMVGWISFSMLIGYAIGQLINGNLADRFSPRYMITIGALLSVAANFAISLSNSYAFILVLWAMNGYFQAMAWAPGSRLISNWWRREERGKAFGFYTMSAGSSSALTFLLSIFIIQQGVSWHSLFLLPAMLLLPVAIIFFFVARSKPSDKGFPDLYPETSELKKSNWKERYAAVLKNRKFIIASIALGFESMARYGLIIWVPVHFLGTGSKNNPDLLWASVLMPIGMATGALCFGKMSDTIFRRNRPASIRAGMLIAAVISLIIYFTPATASHFTIGALMFAAGFFVYGPQANFWPISPDLLGEKYVATGIGIMNMCAYLFAAIGEPIFGKVIDVTKDTSSVFIAISIISALSAITISFCKYRYQK
jgi:OPA family glycerol-3-phosphate transporter-like MFS transporter